MTTTNEQTMTVGSRVEAGKGEDRDTGKVVEIIERRALVAWDSGARTWAALSTLLPTTERHSGGVRME